MAMGSVFIGLRADHRHDADAITGSVGYNAAADPISADWISNEQHGGFHA